MEIRRPIAALMTALTLFGGGATLSACSDPGGIGRNDGTTDKDSTNTEGNNPGGEDQGNLPDTSGDTGKQGNQSDEGDQGTQNGTG